MSQTLVVRLSWVMYVQPIVHIAMLATATLFYLTFLDEIHQSVVSAMPEASPDLLAISSLVPVFLFFIGIFKAVWKICLNRSVVVTIDPSGVTHKGGILPWKQWVRYWRYSQIFGAMYLNRPQFLGWLLRFGDLIIVGREGSTREYTISGIHDPKRAQMLISSRAEG